MIGKVQEMHKYHIDLFFSLFLLFILSSCSTKGTEDEDEDEDDDEDEDED